MPTSILLGTQGWNYPAWIGPLYPHGTRPREFLALYARAFGTVEVDSTFYAIPSAGTVRGWAQRTPESFVFSLKLPREITHERRLVDAGDLLQAFVERARELGPRLGPILVQLGPDFSPAELPALAGFLPLLPRDLRFAVELRDRGWLTQEVHDLLSDHGVALALTSGRWIPRAWALALVARPTAGFHYLRWMGDDRAISDFSRVQIDRSDELSEWAEAIAAAAAAAIPVFGYVNNHFSGHSPATVRTLLARLGRPAPDPERIGDQISLF